MLGTMGQEILKQQQELEERIRGFEDDDSEEVVEGTRERLKELDDAMRAWESQNEGMMRELGGKVSGLSSSGAALMLVQVPEAADEPLSRTHAGKPTPAAPSTLTRRQRNAQHRTLDMEFATEIGQNLLVEVRRLQALLSERDRALEKFGEEKEGWEGQRDGLLAAVRATEGSVVGEQLLHLMQETQLNFCRAVQGRKLEPRGQPPRTPNHSNRPTRSAYEVDRRAISLVQIPHRRSRDGRSSQGRGGETYATT